MINRQLINDINTAKSGGAQYAYTRGAVFAQIWLLSDNWEQCTKFRGAKQSIDSDTDASFYVDTVNI